MKKKKMLIIILIIAAVLLVVQWLFIGWRYGFGPAKALGNIRLRGLPGNAAAYSFEEIEPMEDAPLSGKNVLFLGSSVTNGHAALYNSIPEYFAKRMGCTATKQAVDGTTLTDNGNSSYVQRLLNKVNPDESYDLVVVQLSTNDASKEQPLGAISDSAALADFDTATVTGAMEYIITYAEQTWHCPVVFYTNARFENENYTAMVARAYELQEKYGIGILDLWSDESFNAITEDQRSVYMYDTIHPTMAGYRDWWSPELEAQLCAYLANHQ